MATQTSDIHLCKESSRTFAGRTILFPIEGTRSGLLKYTPHVGKPDHS